MRLSEFLTRSRAALAVAAASAIALAACSAQEPTADPSATDTASVAASPEASASGETSSDALPTSTIDPSPDLSAITVSDADVPEVTVPAPWAIATTQAKVLRESSGAQVVGESASVSVNYVGVNGRTGEPFDSSYEKGAPATLSLATVVPGFKTGLAGQKVGSRVLIGMTGADGYTKGNPQAGIEAGDSLIFVVDILSATFEEAMGEEVAPAEGLPSVTVTDGKPEVTVPEGLATDTLAIQPLIKGPGAAVAADSIVTVKYRAWAANSGTLIADGWNAQTAPLNTLIQGWQNGLVDQTAGSRVLLVVPAAQAYPSGMPDRGLAAGEGLVYVIDILDVQAAPQ
ncbi:MAG: FKBP-type peptidyl-prolyl cis-trans isomerase [Propionibacteriaceae bacterium]|nr:FKBP-type peptidyl-prolyl cis-trans isomerase [Propionibacteriaceae bacterium]